MPSSFSPQILVADDQIDILEALKLLLNGQDFRVEAVTSPDDVIREIEQTEFDLALVDLNFARDTTSGREGFALLDRLRELDPTLPVLVMTGWSSVSVAVEAMRRGARDFIEKPWDNERLLTAVRTQLELRQALRTSRRLQEQTVRLQDSGTPAIIAVSSEMRDIVQTAGRIASSEASVLITGENGTGKEVIAHLVHRLSDRAHRPLVTVNAGALSEGIVESELFGHVKGAFTDARSDRIGCFELADGGTLFLDEIANMPTALQPKLLRVLQTGEVQRVGSPRVSFVNVRLISATNADLTGQITAGRFREDLFYRLNTVVIHLPPLRSRTEDLHPLADHYLAFYSEKYRRTFAGFAPSAEEALVRHPWPGNVRELAHAIERAVLLAQGDRITAADLGLQRARAPDGRDSLTLEEAEKLLIQKVLRRHNGDISRSAKQLGMSRSSLYRRLRHFRL